MPDEKRVTFGWDSSSSLNFAKLTPTAAAKAAPSEVDSTISGLSTGIPKLK